MNARLEVLVCVAVLSAAVPVVAHHSFTAVFDENKPVKLTGTVTKVEWTNPHTWFFVDVKNPDGTITNWGFEMAGPTQLVRAGWRRDALKIGDAVTIDASRARDDSNKANARVVVLSATGKQVFGGPPTTSDNWLLATENRGTLRRRWRQQPPQHLVEPPDECARVLELPAFGEERLVEEDVAPVAEPRFVRLLLKALHDRVLRIDLQDRLAARYRLTSGLEHAFQMLAHVELLPHEARG
jgi:Family of unknown function (DUF6152)